MIYVYGDESMDEKARLSCAVAIIIGRKGHWEMLESKWVDRTSGIPFHANDCDSDQGDYKGIPHADNKALYRDLTIMLAESGLYGFGSVMDLAAYRVAFPNLDKLHIADHAYYKGFMDAISESFDIANANEEIAELTFDNRVETEHNAALLYAYCREFNPGWKHRLASKVIFESSRDNPRIQVADLFAREVMKGLVNDKSAVKREPRKSWKALKESGRFIALGYSTEWFSDALADAPNMASRINFASADYVKWLGKRQPNTTSVIQYTAELYRNKKTQD